MFFARTKIVCQQIHFLTKNFSLSTRLRNQTKLEVNGGCHQITMCNDKTRNSLSLEMMQELTCHIKESCTNDCVRSIVIKGEGPVFSAGHNLKELSCESGKETHCAVFNEATNLMMSIINAPVPVIAVVNGLAAAAGCQLVAACDMAICSEKSSFSTPGVRFGIFCSTPGVPLVRNIPLKISADMLFTAHPITAQQALLYGLVSRVAPEDKLDAELKKIIDAIDEKSREVVQLGKKFLYEQRELDLATAYQTGGEVMVENLSLPDGMEGIQSFIEKRKPVWKHGR